MCTFSASWLFLVIGHPATGHLCRWRDDLAGPGALKSSTLAVGALTTATAAGSSSTGWFWSWAKFSKTEKHSNILHIYESWHVHDSCHIVFGLSKPCQDILINHHQGGSPCPAPSEWVEVKTRHGGACGGGGGERQMVGRNWTSFPRGGGSNSLFGHLMLWREVLHWWLTNGWNVIKILKSKNLINFTSTKIILCASTH